MFRGGLGYTLPSLGLVKERVTLSLLSAPSTDYSTVPQWYRPHFTSSLVPGVPSVRPGTSHLLRRVEGPITVVVSLGLPLTQEFLPGVPELTPVSSLR